MSSESKTCYPPFILYYPTPTTCVFALSIRSTILYLNLFPAPLLGKSYSLYIAYFYVLPAELNLLSLEYQKTGVPALVRHFHL
jgi:hypothetical protein